MDPDPVSASSVDSGAADGSGTTLSLSAQVLLTGLVVPTPSGYRFANHWLCMYFTALALADVAKLDAARFACLINTISSYPLTPYVSMLAKEAARLSDPATADAVVSAFASASIAPVPGPIVYTGYVQARPPQVSVAVERAASLGDLRNSLRYLSPQALITNPSVLADVISCFTHRDSDVRYFAFVAIETAGPSAAGNRSLMEALAAHASYSEVVGYVIRSYVIAVVSIGPWFVDVPVLLERIAGFIANGASPYVPSNLGLGYRIFRYQPLVTAMEKSLTAGSGKFT